MVIDLAKTTFVQCLELILVWSLIASALVADIVSLYLRTIDDCCSVRAFRAPPTETHWLIFSSLRGVFQTISTFQ